MQPTYTARRTVPTKYFDKKVQQFVNDNAEQIADYSESTGEPFDESALDVYNSQALKRLDVFKGLEFKQSITDAMKMGKFQSGQPIDARFLSQE